MDVERTMEFILRMQAKAEARAAAHEEKMAEHQKRMAKLEERMAIADGRMDKFDRRTQAIQKLIATGMRMLVRIEEKHEALSSKVDALTEAQRRSDRKFERLIDLMTKQRSNGHASRN